MQGKPGSDKVNCLKNRKKTIVFDPCRPLRVDFRPQNRLHGEAASTRKKRLRTVEGPQALFAFKGASALGIESLLKRKGKMAKAGAIAILVGSGDGVRQPVTQRGRSG